MTLMNKEGWIRHWAAVREKERQSKVVLPYTQDDLDFLKKFKIKP